MLGVTISCCLLFWNTQAWYISSTYHEVTEYQIWFPFVKGLVGYNIIIFLDDKSLIPKSLACHLKKRGYQSSIAGYMVATRW